MYQGSPKSRSKEKTKCVKNCNFAKNLLLLYKDFNNMVACHLHKGMRAPNHQAVALLKYSSKVHQHNYSTRVGLRFVKPSRSGAYN